jgi:hypothetical protein
MASVTRLPNELFWLGMPTPPPSVTPRAGTAPPTIARTIEHPLPPTRVPAAYAAWGIVAHPIQLDDQLFDILNT